MVVRDLKDGSSIVSTQEDHAELSAQFAAHWGNKDFSKLRPYDSMVFATTYHDSGYREWEGNPPQTFTKPQGRLRERSPEVQAVKKELEARQEEEKKSLGKADAKFERQLWFNYRTLQVYDLLSLYFCCDGHSGDDHLKEDAVAPVPVAYDSKEEIDLRIVPTGANSVKIFPYPFDTSPLKVSVRTRIIPTCSFASAKECSEAYHKALRCPLSFAIAG